MTIKRSDKAPDFSLPSTNGKIFTLSADQKGKPCILYFYPKDFTGGCTAEACDFRNNFEEFKGLNIDVYGISTDPIATHLRFKKKYELPYELLSDEKGEVIRLYNAKVPFVNLTRRITYLLDENHFIKEVYSNMFNINEHVRKMLSEAKAG